MLAKSLATRVTLSATCLVGILALLWSWASAKPAGNDKNARWTQPVMTKDTANEPFIPISCDSLGVAVDGGSLGNLDPSLVSNVVRHHVGQVKSCYEHALVVQPSLTGRIKVRWTIHKSGAVCNQRFEEDTLASQSVRDCIARTIQGWQFAPPAGGAVEVVYPFVFLSGEPDASPPAAAR